MCQITLIKSDVDICNRMFLMNQALVNSAKLNKHGWGISDGQTVWKTEICPHDLLNGGSILSKFKLGDTIMSHVRAATAGIPVVKEMAHPFKNGKFTLVHNGSITLRSKEAIVGSDSERFLAELVRIYPDKKNVPGAIEETQKLFYGPFVYLIHHEDEGWFVARGFGRNIHKLNITFKNMKSGKEFPALVLNSDKADLEEGIQVLRNLIPLVGWEIVEKEIKPEPLVMETIYKLDGYDIHKVGAVKEETAPTKSYAYAGDDYADGYGGHGYYQRSNQTALAKRRDSSYDSVVIWMESNLIDFIGLDYILHKEYGSGLLEVTDDIWEDFKKTVIKRFNLNEGTRKFIIKNMDLPITPGIVEGLGLEYPLAANDHNTIVKALKGLG